MTVKSTRGESDGIYSCSGCLGVIFVIFIIWAIVRVTARILRSDPKPVTAPLQLVLHINVLDPNRWLSTKQLYLRVISSTHTNVEMLSPLTIGENAGKTRFAIRTPFIIQPKHAESFSCELLDDTALSPGESKQIAAVTAGVGYLLLEGGVAYVSKGKMSLPSSLATATHDAIESSTYQVIKSNTRFSFQSQGSFSFDVQDEVEVSQASMDLYDIGKTAQVGVYFLPPEQ